MQSSVYSPVSLSLPEPLPSAALSYNFHLSSSARLVCVPSAAAAAAANGLFLQPQLSLRNAGGRLCSVHGLTNFEKPRQGTISARSSVAYQQLFSTRGIWKGEGAILYASGELHWSRKRKPLGSGFIGAEARLLTSNIRNWRPLFAQKVLGSTSITSSQRLYAELPTPETRSLAMSGDETPKVDEDPKAVGSSVFLAGLMPKKEIGADKFLTQHPSYDGRGVTIAIFDSGIDPAAAGLQITLDGRPKIVDVLDCTGSGDIDTSTIVTADEEGSVTGASGARLQINKSWKNPSGEWRVGSKFVYQLFTEKLVTRVKKERKKRWTEVHRETITEALRQLSAFDLKNPKASEASLKKEREDLQTRYDLLQKQSDVRTLAVPSVF